MNTISNLTAVILTKNSAATLSDCLTSVSFCEHILIADDGSRDDTLLIAKQFGTNRIKLPVHLNFSAKRNTAIEYVKTEWILFVDSDEVVTDALKKSIVQFFAADFQTNNGAWIKREDEFLGRQLQFGETRDIWLLRLGRKDTGPWKRSVHEIWDIGGKKIKLSGVLLHRPHPTIETFIEKINTYTELEAIERTQSKSHASYVSTVLQLFFYPLGKFLYTYVFRQGFRDGFAGFTMSFLMSLHSLCVRIKVLEKLRAKKS